MNIKKISKVILEWIAAIMIGVFIANLICMVYERPVGWIETPNGPSPAGWNPNKVLIHGTEGYGINKIDENGYINPAGSLQDSYVLCMGSSHTQGKELPAGKNYTSLINEHFSKGEGSLSAYNIASDGNFLPTLIKHFSAAVTAFPDADVITIEISNTDVSADELLYALDQTEYDNSQNVSNLASNMGLKDKIKMYIKEYFPLVSLIKSKLETVNVGNSNPSDTENKENDDVEALLDEALAKIRSVYDGKIIFIYHSQTLIQKDGSISFANDKLFETFKNACDKNNIDLLDMRPIFTQYYEQNKEIPYGFSNTRLGNGHLNILGHRLIAEALGEKIEEVIA